MGGVVVHALVPLLFLLAMRRLDRRKIWLLWPLTFAPDLDYVVGAHRATLHNAFILLPFLAVLLWHLRPSTRDLARVEWMGIALTYLGAHILMDVFTGGVTLFYPISTFTLCWIAAIYVETATNTPTVYFEACSYVGIPTVSPIYPWISVSEGAMLAFLVPAALLMAARSYVQHRRRRLDEQRGKQS